MAALRWNRQRLAGDRGGALACSILPSGDVLCSRARAQPWTRGILPDWGEATNEATIVRWLVEPGARVAEGQPLVEVETDKSFMNCLRPRQAAWQRYMQQQAKSLASAP